MLTASPEALQPSLLNGGNLVDVFQHREAAYIAPIEIN